MGPFISVGLIFETWKLKPEVYYVYIHIQVWVIKSRSGVKLILVGYFGIYYLHNYLGQIETHRYTLH